MSLGKPSDPFDARAITRSGHSSFLPAFALLPRARRTDLEVLHAFCRVADDIADLEGPAESERLEVLAAWRAAFADPEMRGLPDSLRGLIARRGLDCRLFLELLDGIATDLSVPVRMATRADLDLYCHRVAGVVGRLCLPVFGADKSRSAPFAGTLGRALQYTNILRDTGSDFACGRLYFPLDELAAAGIDARNFGKESGVRQEYLADFAARSGKLFGEAARLVPEEDRRALRPARIMAAIYRRLLEKMRRDGLRVFEKRYRLSPAEKLTAAAAALVSRQ